MNCPLPLSQSLSIRPDAWRLIVLALAIVFGLCSSVIGQTVSHGTAVLVEVSHQHVVAADQGSEPGAEHDHHNDGDHMHDIPGQLVTVLTRDTAILDSLTCYPDCSPPFRAHYPFERPPKTLA
jgi:hypothetical protein